MFKYVLLLLLAFPFMAEAEDAYTPKPGTELRKTLMNTLREPVIAELHQRVVFKIDWLKVKGNWAFMRGQPLQPNGKEVDYQNTRYQIDIEDGLFDDWFCALLRSQNNQWRVVAYDIGATDVAYVGWWDKYRAPPEIFDIGPAH